MKKTNLKELIQTKYKIQYVLKILSVYLKEKMGGFFYYGAL
jgi:hypothetical protein